MSEDEQWELKQLRRQNAEMTEFIKYLKTTSTGYTLWEEVLAILQKKHGSERICDVLKIEEFIFPEIVSYSDIDEEYGAEFCYRFHYTDNKKNELHKLFMLKNGWEDTGKSRINSGNGTLHIYKNKKMKFFKKMKLFIRKYLYD